ncbi:hypothetical protein PRUPE_1G487100 [Prunus persica]|uniref:Uncharacterized protein n=1 Tax=Prunus persica TaxID=3760 RepID=A0A251REU7_PRUPE|nr:hypothetical protein PRUPE_1G487100 [Prunus persica]
MDSNIIFFTNLLFAGITDACFVLLQHVVVLPLPKTTPSIAVGFFSSIAIPGSGFVLIDAISSIWALVFVSVH